MVDDLYQEMILDHSKHPRNCHAVDDATRNAEGYNPLCGDKLKLYVKMEGDIVKDASFMGSGCAISTASASLMTESLKGKTRDEASQTAGEIPRLTNYRHSRAISTRLVKMMGGKIWVESEAEKAVASTSR